jgi:hypothetical protein
VVSRVKKSVLKTALACVAVVALMLPMAGGAQAEQRNFCWGANLAPGAGCQSGSWRMYASYANSMDGQICLYLPSVYAACSGGANQGVYIGNNCAYQRTSMINYNNYWIKGHGTFWTC